MSWVDAAVQGILLGGLFALFACGLSLLFGVMEVINLAHGDIAVCAAYLAVVLIPATHIPPVWVFVLVVPAFAVGGYLLQRGLLRPALSEGPLTTLLVTFGLSILLENVLLEVFTANSHSISIGILSSGSFQITPQLSLAYLSLLILGVAVVVLVGLQLFLSRTATGRMIRAIADDKEAAEIVGANADHIFGIAAGLAFGTVALAGLALAMYSQVDPSAGPNYLIYGFEAVVIGGLGSLWGTLAGGIVLGIATTVALQISPDFGALGPHLVFLAVLAFRPRGFFPKRAIA
jgi:branched-chain amino acid transport system permease protein